VKVLAYVIRTKRIRKTALVLVSSTLMFSLSLIGLSSASASSNQYSGSQESAVGLDGSGQGVLKDVSCPLTTLCVAVGTDSSGEGVTTTGTDTSGTWGWSTESPVAGDGAGGGSLSAVSCPSPTQCVAVGNDSADEGVTTTGTDTSGTWSWSTESAVANDGTGQGPLNSVSCPSPTLCVAVGEDFHAQGFTTIGTDASGTWSWTAESQVANDEAEGSLTVGNLESVNCPLTTLCVAVGFDLQLTGSHGVTTTGTDVSGTWSWSTESPVANDATGDGLLWGVSCPLTTQCVAVGNDGNAGITTTGTDTSGTWSWSTESPVASDATGFLGFIGVSCPSTTLCAAVGGDSAGEGVTTTGTDVSGTWSWSTESPVANDASGGGSLSAVSCPLTTLCVAVGNDGNAGITTTGTDVSGTWSWSTESPVANDASGGGSLSAVSCPLTTLCVAVGKDAASQGVTTIGTDVSGTWGWSTESPVASDGAGRGSLSAVSCPLMTLCVAVGDDSAGEGVTTIGTDTSGTWSWSTESAVANDGTAGGSLSAVSCPSPTLCVAVGTDSSGEGVTTTGTDTSGTWSWSTESLVANDGTGFGALSAVSCPLTTQCVAVGTDGSGEGVTTIGTDTSGTWSWSAESAVANDGTGSGLLWGVSCPSTTLCVAVGEDEANEGVTTTGTDVSGTWSWSTETAVADDASGGGSLSAVSCPLTTLCVAVGEDEASEGVTTTGTDASGTWSWSTETAVANDGTAGGDLNGVSCATNDPCIAVGMDGVSQGVFSVLSIGNVGGGTTTTTTGGSTTTTTTSSTTTTTSSTTTTTSPGGSTTTTTTTVPSTSSTTTTSSPPPPAPPPPSSSTTTVPATTTTTSVPPTSTTTTTLPHKRHKAKAPGLLGLHVYFANNSSVLTTHYRALLTELAKEIIADHTTRITITGYASDTGPNPHNQVLSELRAQVVRTFLKSILSAKGYTSISFSASGGGVLTQYSNLDLDRVVIITG
jgi:outer membrane protein OmpA-like peptidoglycan-associated protein